MMKALGVFILTFVVVECMAQSIKDRNEKTIICLTYDDEIESHSNVVIPLLDSLRLKATFFINSVRGSGTLELSVVNYKRAAKNGHELANHTLFHPCPEKYGFPKELAIESYTLSKLFKEIELSNLYLTAIDGEQRERAFGYTCDNTIVEGIDYSTKLKESRLVKYARIGGGRASIIRDYNTLNPMKVPGWTVEQGTTLDELIEFAKDAKENGKMGVYVFHGVGVPPFEVAPEVHKKFLEYLTDNQNEYWVTTFSAAMDHVTKKIK